MIRTPRFTPERISKELAQPTSYKLVVTSQMLHLHGFSHVPSYSTGSRKTVLLNGRPLERYHIKGLGLES